MLQSKIVVVGSIIYIPYIHYVVNNNMHASSLPYIPIDVGIDYWLINMHSVVSWIIVIFVCERKNIKPSFDIVKCEISWVGKQYYTLSVCLAIIVSYQKYNGAANRYT